MNREEFKKKTTQLLVAELIARDIDLDTFFNHYTASIFLIIEDSNICIKLFKKTFFGKIKFFLTKWFNWKLGFVMELDMDDFEEQ